MAKDKKEKLEEMPEMTLEEAKAYRASLCKPEVIELSGEEKREQFRLFWAQEKHKYGKSKDLEPILWLHLKAIKMDEPSKFSEGILNFGLRLK